ncbi:S8 family serine peptidase [Haloarchaeobius sp. TZWWS8]|uniref:S8 family serine peptidase n=1 Tax=Haloarchaeobius sp. TZWWS8 TaxID=3446121 RepID=UPI003EB8730E
MSRRGVAVALVTVILLSSVTGVVGGTDHGQGELVRVIVVFEDHTVRADGPVAALGGHVTGGRDIQLVPVVFAMIPERAIPRLANNPHVAGVYPDAVATAIPQPQVSASSQTEPWGIARVGAATGISVAGISPNDQEKVQVAVVDTGIDYDHEDLRNNVADWGVRVTTGEECLWVICWPTEKLSYGKDAADDDNGHGTHVAGTIAAEDNGLGVVGVAPHVQLYPVKVLDHGGNGPYSVIMTGMDEAVKGPDGIIGTPDDADVLSMSLSGPTAGGLCDAVNRAVDAGVVVVAAAGNTGDGDTGTDDVRYPAKCGGAIAVAATNSDDGTPSWSAEGPDVDIAGPGVSVYSTERGNGYSYKSGTSMATPHVSATAALVLAQDMQDGAKDLSPAAVRTRLVDTAADIAAAGFDRDTGHGLVQVDRVLAAGLQTGAGPVTIGETGTVTVSQGGRAQWHTVSLSNSFDDPVVVMDPASYNGVQPVHVRVRNVQSSSFQFKLEEWNYLDGGHVAETVSYLVLERGVHTLADGRVVEAGTTLTDENADFVSFSAPFDETPVVLSQVQTYDGPDAVVTRVKGITTGGFTVWVAEEEAEGPHVVEQVGYVALVEGDADLDGTAMRVATTNDVMTHGWKRVDFGAASYGAAPVFLAAMQTTDGGDPAGLRYRNLDGDGVEVKVEEEQSADSETSHTSEVVGYTVFERAGTIYGY